MEGSRVMGERHIIVVDLETTGFDPSHHTVIEVAWRDLDTWDAGSFIPPHRWRDIAFEADPAALRVSGYLDRIVGLTQDTTGEGANALAMALHGNVLAGSNPAFDAAFLRRMFTSSAYDADYRPGEYGPLNYDVFEPEWHHRLLDLSAYAAGVLAIDPTELPGLVDVCKRLGVANLQPHSACGDCDATATCFSVLGKLAQEREMTNVEVHAGG